jgi:hypothetical protein
MPSRTSAARRRFHRDHVIANRFRQAERLSPTDPADYVRGRLANHQHYLGCHRARCGICHPHKRWPNSDRQRAERAWREAEGC